MVREPSLAEWGPVSTLPSLHRKQGVTSVTCHGGYVYTTGRDSSYYQLFVRGGQLQPVLRQKPCPGMNWVAGVVWWLTGAWSSWVSTPMSSWCGAPVA